MQLRITNSLLDCVIPKQLIFDQPLLPPKDSTLFHPFREGYAARDLRVPDVFGVSWQRKGSILFQLAQEVLNY